jgi:hypothetical protein
MKIKPYLFRFLIAVSAFTFGVLCFGAWQTETCGVQPDDPETAAILPASQPENVVLQPAEAEVPMIETTPVPDLNENVEYTFDAAGDYQLVDAAPKNFKDFESIVISTTDYTGASEENAYQGTPIPPEGALWTTREYKFTRINIANKQIAFETEARKKVSYKFVGKFVDNVQNEEGEYADLEGRLVKMRNGKKIAESRLRLVVSCGC